MTTYNFTIKAINSGTDGSAFGHVWFTVTPNDGSQSQTFGFYPDGMHQNDDSAHPSPDFFRSWELTQDQKNDLDRFILDYVARKEYLFPWEVCVDFAIEAARAADVDIRQGGDGPLFPGHLDDWLDEDTLPGIFDQEYKYWNDAHNTPAPRDPLAIDLDNDGIETVGVDAGVLFDHNADGIRTGTGWLKGDDAFLVLDRNGNGVIDSGRELFGVDTVVSEVAGSDRYAADAFVALSSIDSNGDDVFNAADEQFGNVRLWRDLNQDGVSQADELMSLAEAGITGIDLTTKRATKALPGGNTQSLTADVAGLEGAAAALNLADNPFYREFADTLDTSAVADLPDMQGSGTVRDLKEAATLSSTLAAQLRSLNSQGYVNRDTYLGQIKQIIDAWADTSTVKDLDARQDLSPLELEELGNSVTSPGEHKIVNGSGMDMTVTRIVVIYQPVGVDRTLLERAAGVSTVGTGGGGTAGLGEGLDLSEAEQAAQLAKWQRLTYLIETLERYNGQTFVNLEPDKVTDVHGRDLTIGVGGGSSGSGGGASGAGGVFPVFISMFDEQIALLEQSYAELVESVYDGLLLQTRLKGYMDSIDLVIDETGIRLDFAALEQMIAERRAINAQDAFVDQVELMRTNDRMLLDQGWTTALPALKSWVEEVASDPAWTATLDAMHVGLANGTYQASQAADTVFGGTGNDNLYGNGGADLLDGGNGNDLMLGGDGNDLLIGGAGTDNLQGQAGNDILNGGDGNDSLDAGTGDDVLDGGTGNDHMIGGDGNDTYLFGLGSGQDRISNLETAGGQDVIELGAGILPGQVTLRRAYDSLVISIVGTSDTLQVNSYFQNNACVVQEIRFADGTVWDEAYIRQTVQIATEGNDEIWGDDVTDDVFSGAGGDDGLFGLGGNDTLNGDAGRDHLHGGEGNDTLNGGDGIDILYGDAGDDVLDGGVGDDTLLGYGESDLLTGGAGNDSLDGGTGNDVLLGGEGNDTLAGGTGDDVLDGGAGADHLEGGTGNDTYRFGLGSGFDRIANYSVAGSTDVIELGEGILPEQVSLRRHYGDTLVLSINGTTDVLWVDSFFQTPNAEVQEIRFKDGTVWDAAYMKQAVQMPTDGNDFIWAHAGTNSVLSGGAGDDMIWGASGADTLNGDAGRDNLWGGGANDTLFGGDGNDTLFGEAGDDVLDGGAGDDTLYGGDGSDTYLFGLGSGRDRISNTVDAGTKDAIQVGDGVLASQVKLRRSSSNLIISINGAPDTLQVDNYFQSDSNVVQEIKFADGTTWNVDYVKQNVQIAGDGDDELWGTAGNDNLNGGAGNDILIGLDGSDTLVGGTGNDLLDGGVGNDSLQGGVGNDTYLLRGGSGLDAIMDTDSTAANSDTVQFVDVASAELTALERQGDNLVLKYGASDQVTFQGYFYSSDRRIEQFIFSDGVTWDDAAIKARVITLGTSAVNTITGYNDGTNRIYGLDGGDTLYGGALSDVLDGGIGSDYLFGRAGDDTLTGGVGDDVLYGEAGNDTLDGGVGTDNLQGGAGNDTYLLRLAAGVDTITDLDSTAGNTDTVQFVDVASTELTALERQGDNLVLKYSASDQLTVIGYFNGDYRVEQFIFSDGVVWDDAAIKARVITLGTSAVNNITGYNDGTNRIYGFDSNDNLKGGALSDLLDGGNGNDILSGKAGDDTLTGGAGDDTLMGEADNDILDGGTGTDNLQGGTGNDTYLFRVGSGVDTIMDMDSTLGNSDTVQFVDVASTGLTALERNGYDLTLKYGTSDQVTVQGYFSSSNSRIEQFKFSDGVIWDDAAIKARVITLGTSAVNTITGYNDGTNRIYGFDSTDYLNGGALSDLLDGGNGNDTLSGKVGDDTLVGGAGNDTLVGDVGNDILDGGIDTDSLQGGVGSDTYRFGLGYGADTVSDIDSTAGNSDIASFLSGIATDQIWFRHVGTALEVSVIGTSDKLTIQSWYSGSQYHVEQFKTADGLTLLDSQVENLVQAMAAFSPPAAGQTTLPPTYQDALGTTIAANWQ